MTKFTTTGPDGTTVTRNSKRDYTFATWINWQGEGWKCKSFHTSKKAAEKFAGSWIRAGRSEVKIIEVVA